jgi:hypothetical protein
MRSVWLAVVTALPLALVACVPPPVYKVQRTARVPHPAVPMRTGEPLDGPIELSVGMNSFGDTKQPELMDSQASVEVPNKQMRSELRIRLGREGARGELAPIFEQALASGMKPVDPTQAPVREGSPTGVGIAFRYSIPTGVDGLSIGTGIEAMSWEIPYVEYRTCVAYCAENNAPQMQINHGSEGVGTLGFALTPTYRSGPVAMFAGAYTRRQPTIVRKGTEEFAMDYDQDVSAGNYNMVVHAGIEYRLPAVSFLATVQQDLTADPVLYGPTFGLAIALRVPNHPKLPYHDPQPEPRPASAPVLQSGPPGDPTTSHDTDDALPEY